MIRISDSIASGRQRKKFIVILVFLLLANLGARLVRLHADAPALPAMFRNIAAFKDEGEKAHEARNRVLFGSWRSHPEDNFLFWSSQAPVWVWVNYGWFKLWGVSFASMRGLSIFWALVTIAAASLLLWREGFRSGALLVPFLLGLNFYYLAFTRLGLMESMTIAEMTLTVLALAESRRRPVFFLLATIFFLGAALTKQSALLLFPLWAACLFLLLYSPSSSASAPSRFHRRTIALLAVLLIVVVVLTAWSQPSFRQMTLMNFRHGYHLTPDEAPLESVLKSLKRIGQSFTPREMWQGFFLLFPSTSLLGLGWMIFLFRRLARRQNISSLEWMLLAWLLLWRFSAVITPKQVVRFHLYYFVPLALFAAMTGDRLWSAATQLKSGPGTVFPSRFFRRSLLVVLLLYELAMSGGTWLSWVTYPQYQLVNNSRRLGKTLAAEEKRLGRPAVVIGEWAGPFSLEHRMICHYVKGPFNSRREQLERFGITHLLETTSSYDFAVGRVIKVYPELYATRQFVADFTLQKKTMRLWRVHSPPRTSGKQEP